MKKVFKRDSAMANILAMQGTTIKATAKISRTSKKKGYLNILLEDVEFTAFNNIQVMDHVWLQERDALKEMYNMIGEEVKVIFKFYQYRDAIDRNMCGITILRILSK